MSSTRSPRPRAASRTNGKSLQNGSAPSGILKVPASRGTPATTEKAPSASDDAIERAVSFLRKKQLRSGAWIAGECFEPQSSATHVVVLSFLDRLNPVEARGYARFLATLQQADGSFLPYPYAAAGDLV